MTTSWPDLVVLMAFGGDGTEDHVAGVVRTREGRNGGEHEFRVARRGELVRLSRLDGRPTMIVAADRTWGFAEAGPPTEYDQNYSWGFTGQEVVRRAPMSRWEGDDFTRLTGPIEACEILGRPAWSFELAPPRRKPYPLQMIVDAATGIVLREGNRDFGSVTEWVEIDIDADLPHELFWWDGPTRPPPDREAEHEQQMAERRAWLAAHDIDLDLPVSPEVTLHEWSDESGAFHASFHSRASGSLVRRPVGRPAPNENFPHLYRWCDERWDWLLGSIEPIDDEQLAAIQARLAQSR